MSDLQQQFSEIYDQHVGRVYRFLYFKVSSRETAEDLSSEVFVRAWKVFGEREIENTKAFLYGIARHILADYYRRETRARIVPVERVLELPDTGRMPDVKVGQILEMERVRLALRELKDEYQDFIILRYVEELSVSEVAAITGKSEESIRVGTHRALQALKARLGTPELLEV